MPLEDWAGRRSAKVSVLLKRPQELNAGPAEPQQASVGQTGRFRVHTPSRGPEQPTTLKAERGSCTDLASDVPEGLCRASQTRGSAVRGGVQEQTRTQVHWFSERFGGDALENGQLF